MKYFFHLLLLLLMVRGTALADNFQIAFWQGNSSSYVAYSSVRLFDKNNKQVFTGSTDKYGRIVVNNLANGSYRIEIDCRGKTCRKAIAIDHSNAFKIVNLSAADLSSNDLSLPAADLSFNDQLSPAADLSSNGLSLPAADLSFNDQPSSAAPAFTGLSSFHQLIYPCS